MARCYRRRSAVKEEMVLAVVAMVVMAAMVWAVTVALGG